MSEPMTHPTRVFKLPEELEAAFEAYKLDVKKQSNEWLKVQYIGKNAERKTDPQKVPYTMEGFKRFCRENYGNVHQYFENKDGLYSDFVGICTRVRLEIRENQIIGGMLGFYNPSITARLTGLTDKKENKDTSEPRVFPITGMQIINLGKGINPNEPTS